MAEPAPGLARERTALAWQRTSLALVAGAALVARLAPSRLGPATLLLAAVWLLAVLVLLRVRRGGSGPDGVAAASLTGAFVLLCATELVVVATGHR